MAGKVQKACIELRAKGYTPKEIAKTLDKNEGQIYMVCKRLGLQTTEEEHEQVMSQIDYSAQFNDPNEYVSRYSDKLIYHHGYTNCDKSAWVECIECGYVYEISMVTIRHHETRCPQCTRLARKKDFRNTSRIAQGKQVEMHILKCIECGKEYYAENGRAGFCSDECRHRRINRGKDHRIAKDKVIDKDITLRKLYKRDKGVCWICGGLCDYEADKNSEEYPSIDHVIAVSQGGEHAWNNVRLAHRGCNLKRYYTEQKYAPS